MGHFPEAVLLLCSLMQGGGDGGGDCVSQNVERLLAKLLKHNYHADPCSTVLSSVGDSFAFSLFK